MTPRAFFERAALDRRRFLIGSALGAGSLILPGVGLRRAHAASDLALASSIRSLSNAFHAAWNAGGEAFAKSVEARYSALVTEGNSGVGTPDAATPVELA